MNRIIFSAVLSLFVVVNATKTPVLIWSPSRPLSDLPQSYAGSTVAADSFHKKYLAPLSSGNGKTLIVFQQDKLSVEDFTNHADVYNPNSDGGAFKNVKSAMDEQFSVHLPAVVEASSAINSLYSSFPGEVIRVDNPTDIGTLNLENNKSYLIIVTLQPIDMSREYDSFKKNDEDIGLVLQNLKKRDIKYSAIYTAESPSKISNEEVKRGRQLLDADEDNNGTFVASNGVMMFLKAVSVSITPDDAEPTDKPFTDLCQFTDASQLVITDVTNSTKNMKLTLKGTNGTAIIVFDLMSTNQYEFVSVNETFSYEQSNPKEDKYSVKDMPMKFKIQATRGFCYHCTKLRAQPWLKDYNGTDSSVKLQLINFQIEAYNPYSNSTTRFTDNVWDCVEFFTIPIWMGIITTLLLVMVLFYGITMLSNLTTMDRFDDPKGKTITVTVNE